MFPRDPYAFSNQSSIPQPIVDVLSAVLKSWDTPRSDAFISHFKQNGTLHVLPEPASGHQALKTLHDAAVNPENGPVVGVKHYVGKCFVVPRGKIKRSWVGKRK